MGVIPTSRTLEAVAHDRDLTARLRRELDHVRRLSRDLIVREQAARTAAETANRSKDEFLATLSHEMRTPLNVVLGLIWRLRNRAMDADAVAHALDVIDRNTRLQAQLVEDLLDVSRIITGKLRLHVLPLDLQTVVNEAVDAVRSAADAKGIRLDVALAAEAIRVQGDPLRLQQVVWNLLSNAVKFTPQGGRVTVGVERVNSSARLTVTDTGIGIARELIPYVFDRFRQGDSTSTRRHGGLGLGLSIVRHLVELHGGSVSVTSEGEGRGARFELTLPLSGAESMAERRAARQRVLSMPSLEGVRVLVAEDKHDARAQLQTSLEQYKADVVSVATIKEAVDTVDDAPPDVLIADVHMTDQSIDPLMDKLRTLEHECGRLIPAVAVSQYVRSEDRVHALLAGFKSYMSIPINPRELAAVVASLTRKPPARHAPPSRRGRRTRH